MGLVLFVVCGAFVGWLAAAVEEVDEGVLARMGIGILGAVLSGVLLVVVEGNRAITDLTWVGVFVGLIGATTLLGLVNLASEYSPRGPNAV